MPLSTARPYSTPLPTLPDGPPYQCQELSGWIECPFWLTPSDSRLLELHNGHPAPSPPLENLEGLRHYWLEHPEWMDMLHPDSPVYTAKNLERALYLDFWKDFLPHKIRVLDIGAGVGRLTQIALHNDCEVQAIDPDLRSLWKLLSHAAGGRGQIDLHWSTAECLPALGFFETVIACEVLNYVEDPVLCLQQIHKSLHPKGILLLSVEARWGWALSNDVAEGTLSSFLETGIIHVPHDRWIRTYTKEELITLLKDFDIVSIQPSHYSLSGPFEMIVGQRSIEELLSAEEKLRNHPIAKNLNRAWMVIAQKR